MLWDLNEVCVLKPFVCRSGFPQKGWWNLHRRNHRRWGLAPRRKVWSVGRGRPWKLPLTSPCKVIPETHPKEQVSGIEQAKVQVPSILPWDVPELTAAALANMYAHTHTLIYTQKSECTEDKKPLNVKVRVSPSSCGCWRTVRIQALGSDCLGLNSQLTSYQVWPWGHCLASTCLSFLTCKLVIEWCPSCKTIWGAWTNVFSGNICAVIRLSGHIGKAEQAWAIHYCCCCYCCCCCCCCIYRG